MRKAISQHWFLITLVACLAIGFGVPDLIRPLASLPVLRSSITAAVLFLMGLSLDAHSAGQHLRRPWPVLLGIGFSTLLVPLLALPSLWLLSAEMAGGLIVASLVPCTLASAAVWTRKAGGEDAVAMVVSVVTNLACFAVAPLGLWLILGAVTEVSARDQIVNLALWVVLPMVLGQALRRWALEAWAGPRRAQLSTLAQLGILTMVAFGSVASADRLAGTAAQHGGTAEMLLEIAAAGGLAVLVHCAALVIGIAAARRLGLSVGEQIAVGFAGSQKTLMVGLQIALDCGVSVLPMVIYHVGQLMIDTVVASRWAQRQQRSGFPAG